MSATTEKVTRDPSNPSSAEEWCLTRVDESPQIPPCVSISPPQSVTAKPFNPRPVEKRAATAEMNPDQQRATIVSSVQSSPVQTRERGWGSCRDLATLFIKAVRTLGFGATIVSGYLHNPAQDIVGSHNKKIRARHGTPPRRICAINTGAQWLTVSRISATSSIDRVVVDPVSCRFGA